MRSGYVDCKASGADVKASVAREQHIYGMRSKMHQMQSGSDQSDDVFDAYLNVQKQAHFMCEGCTVRADTSGNTN